MVLKNFINTIAKPHVKRLTDGSEGGAAGGFGTLGAKASATGRFFVIFEKNLF